MGGGSAGGSGSCGGESSRVNTHNAVTSTAIRPTLHSLLVPATDIFSLRPPPRDRPFHFPPREARNYFSSLPVHPRDSILDSIGDPLEESLLLEDLLFRGKERKREKSILSSSVWPRIGLDSGRTTRRESRKRLTSFSDILHYLGRHARGSGFERHTIVGRSVTGMKSISAPK